MTPIRILVTGSRDWTDRHSLEAALNETYWSRPGTHIVYVHGDCETGADRMCKEWVARMQLNGLSVSEEPHPADWYPNGKLDRSAGPKRNGEMVALGPYEQCLAFPLKGNGTWDCIKRANRAGIAVRIVPAKESK